MQQTAISGELYITFQLVKVKSHLKKKMRKNLFSLLHVNLQPLATVKSYFLPPNLMNLNSFNMGLKDGGIIIYFHILAGKKNLNLILFRYFTGTHSNPEQQWHRNMQIFLQSTLKTQRDSRRLQNVADKIASMKNLFFLIGIN